MNSVRSNNLSLKYQRLKKLLGPEYFVTKTQFLLAGTLFFIIVPKNNIPEDFQSTGICTRDINSLKMEQN